MHIGQLFALGILLYLGMLWVRHVEDYLAMVGTAVHIPMKVPPKLEDVAH